MNKDVMLYFLYFGKMNKTHPVVVKVDKDG